MRRRTVLLAGAALALPTLTLGQQRAYRVGWLVAGPAARPQPENAPFIRTFLSELQRLGFSEGGNLIFEYRGVEGDFERVDAALRDLMQRKVDVIYSGADRITRRLKSQIKSVPVVFTSFDPVQEGFVGSLARPGTNLTGISVSAGPELEAKRLHILKEMLPSVRRVAFLGAAFEWDNPFSGVAVRKAARTMEIELWQAECGEKEIASGLKRIARTRPDAVFIPSSATMHAFRRQIGEFLREQRIPGACGFEESVESGGLLFYGMDLNDASRRIAGYVARILKGSDPSTMPVEQPTTFRMVINQRSARELGIAVPHLVLVRADRVIE